MICEALTILIYHTEGSSPSGAVLRQGRGPEVCGRVGILSDQNFLQVQVDYWIHGKGTFTRIVPGYSLFGPGLPGKGWSCILVAGFHPEGWAFGLLEGYFDFLKTVELLFFFFGHGISVSTIIWSVWYMFWTTCKSKFSTQTRTEMTSRESRME